MWYDYCNCTRLFSLDRDLVDLFFKVHMQGHSRKTWRFPIWIFTIIYVYFLCYVYSFYVIICIFSYVSKNIFLRIFMSTHVLDFRVKKIDTRKLNNISYFYYFRKNLLSHNFSNLDKSEFTNLLINHYFNYFLSHSLLYPYNVGINSLKLHLLFSHLKPPKTCTINNYMNIIMRSHYFQETLDRLLI